MAEGSYIKNSKEPGERPPEIRVFISSTFRDMHDEREYIIKYVFPELRMICRERGVEFTEIDLRWGVTAEEAEQGKVLKICLDEIDRCRPYFLGILGERYGWTPRLEDVQKDPELLEAHPWVVRCIENGISVTEMEMLYGVLENPKMADHAFFYFRDKKKTRQEFKEDDLAIIEKLETLKKRIRSDSFPVHEDFPDPPALGKLIRDDLLEVINKNFPLDEAPSALERKRSDQEAYALTRRRIYIPRPENLARLDEHVNSENQPLIITGESGSGKSSLLAYWAHQFRLKNKDSFLIQHYVGAGSSDTGHLGIILRIMEEVKERYDLDDDIPTIPEQLESDLPEWLAKVQNEKLVLLIDSLDRLSDSSRLISWMPKHFPPTIRLIVSTTGGEMFHSLKEKGFEHHLVELLKEHECDELIVNYLGNFRKALSPAQRSLITRDKKSANPLFLRTVLEELRIFGSFEQLNEHIEHYMGSQDMSDLFQRMLARMEHDYGKESLEAILSLIWASRKGLSETEIMEIAGINRLQLSHILLALEFQLLRGSGLLDFYHGHLRSAVDERYFKTKATDDDIRKPYVNTHGKIANYFKDQHISERKAEELPWQYEQAGEFERLKEAISEIPMFMKFTDGDKQFELLGYWRKIGDLSLMEQEYDKGIENFFQSAKEITDVGQYFDKLAYFLQHCGRSSFSEKYFNRAVDIRSTEFGHDSELAEESRFRLAVLKWWIQGDYAGAKSLFEKNLLFREKKNGRKHPETAQILCYLGNLDRLEARYSEAEQLFKEAIDIIETTKGPDHFSIVPAINPLAELYREKGDYTAAEPLFQKAYEICKRTLGKDHPTTIEAFHNLADIYDKKGDSALAEKCYREEIHKLENIYGKEHPVTVLGMNNLGSILLYKGEVKEAEQLFREVLEIEEKIFGTEHFHTAGSSNNLAEALHALGQFDESEKYYTSSWQTFEKIFGADHPINAHPIHGLGKLLSDKGDYAIASEFFENAFSIRHKAFGNHPETAQSLEEYCKTLEVVGQKEKAAKLREQLTAMKATLAEKAEAT